MGTDIITAMAITRTDLPATTPIGEALRAAGWKVGTVSLTDPSLAYAQVSAALGLGTFYAKPAGLMDALDDLRQPTALIITEMFDTSNDGGLIVRALQARALSSRTLCPVPFSLIFTA